MRRRFTDLDRVWPAGLGRRLGAMIYDSFLVMAIWVSMALIAVALNQGEANESRLFQGLLFAMTFAFFAFCWMRAGMTLGMQAWRLRVQTLDGASITLVQSLIRFLVACLSLALLGLGYWWVLFDGQRRSWPDIASSTEVVVLPKPEKTLSKQ
ncbi:RDD family protein [Halomonas sp. ML-15]|uniref:RDD family protein n=1 Tax=Halomonas sp. ML-15 TaxID=2773305 RepID=UPI0017466793|nr:RDD family protein [Halomonas sp. ML-15]MBD3896659.1 RDD family protein [Halomonas sp. ML-15]